MNKTSSRSHVIVFITVEQRELQRESPHASGGVTPPPGMCGLVCACFVRFVAVCIPCIFGVGVFFFLYFVSISNLYIPSSPKYHCEEVKRGMLTIVDLAGSERVSKSRSDGQVRGWRDGGDWLVAWLAGCNGSGNTTRPALLFDPVHI